MRYQPMLLLLPCLLAPALASAQEDAPKPAGQAEQVGTVNFPVSCKPAAQLEFNRAMALFHSFWFDRAKASFAKVLRHDPRCGMAHWGIALMSMGNPFGWAATPGAAAAGAPAAERARRIGARSARERDYIAALASFFKDWKSTPFMPRAVAFEKGMAEVAGKYPYDDEARILHALLLNVTAQASDKTFANQRWAAEILGPLFKKYPKHPGVAHYLIHTYDYAELAELGLPAARAYETIAPAVPHALHMPSHIYARLGMWKETVDGNRASYEAAKGELKRKRLNVGAYDALHAMDYMVFAQLQQAQDKAARALVDEAAAMKIEVGNVAAAYALAAMPARYALERGDWAGAARLRLSPPGQAWSKFPQAEGILVFARGLGAARSGDLAAARRDVQRLQALQDALAGSKNDYWAAQTAFQRQSVEAWIALAEGRRDEALRLMRAAAEAEEASDKHPVTPGNVVPSRQLLADMLVELEQPAEAQAEYERSLRRDPNRYRSLYGAARSAQAAGRPELAREHFTRLWAITANRDSDRPELAPSEADAKER